MGVLLHYLALEGTAALRARGGNLPFENNAETVGLLIIYLVAQVRPWFALGHALQRPRFAVWLGCIAIGLVLMFLTLGVGTALIMLTGRLIEGAEITWPVYVWLIVSDYLGKIGIVLAFLSVNWRIALAVGVAFAEATVVGLASAVAVIAGHRWFKREVEDRIFD